MEHKHTPGPWSVRFDFVVQATSFDGGRLVPVAQPYGVNSDGTDLFANARLIAAAPELLRALIFLVNAHEHPAAASSGRRGVLEYVPVALDHARAAIAKATGSQT